MQNSILVALYNLEKAMLTKLDDSIIGMFQWIVRQIELLTSITRITCLNIVFYPLLIASGILSAFILVDFNVPLIMFFLLPLLFEVISLTVAYSTKETLGTLPQAVKKRRLIRIIVTTVSLFFICTNFMPSLYFLYLSENLFSKATLSQLLYLAPFICIPLTEYVLCTSNLPPSEKEKHKMEKN